MKRFIVAAAPLALFAGLILMLALAFKVVAIPSAHADPKPGLWQEAVTQADGVTVRVLRDTTQGNFNVCYLASRLEPGISPSDPRNVAVAISCLPERKP